MWRETNVFGVFMTPLVVYLLATAALFVPLRALLIRAGLERWTWNTPLALLSIFVCILGLLVTCL